MLHGNRRSIDALENPKSHVLLLCCLAFCRGRSNWTSLSGLVRRHAVLRDVGSRGVASAATCLARALIGRLRNEDCLTHDRDWIDTNRFDRWERKCPASTEAEFARMPGTFDLCPVKITFGKGGISVRACIVGDEKFAIGVVHSERRKPLDFDAKHFTVLDGGCLAYLDQRLCAGALK